MSAPVKQCSFAGGEISPLLWGRTDHDIYAKAVRTLRNMIPMRHGGATGRPGTQYVGTTLNNGNPVRLIPFVFNETGLGQSYVLEFGNLYIAFYQNGGVVTSGGVPYTIVSPYAQADLSTLKFAESADVITIVHPSYPPYELKRLGATNWTITQIISFTPSQAGPTNPVISGTGGTAQLAYLITAVDANGTESDGGVNAPGIITTQAATLTPASVAAPITLTWTPATGAVFYRIYFSTAVKPGPVTIPSGNWGYIGQSTATTFVDNGLTPNYQTPPPIPGVTFGSPGNYPSAVGFVQQRRAFANTNNNPVGSWLSHPGDYANLYVSAISQDSDAVSFSIAGEEVNAIQHIVELKFMLLLTAGSEIFLQGNGSGVVTPSAINASTQSQYGSSPLRPLKIGDVLLFNQALGSFIRDFSFDFAIDGYRGNDITVFAAHMFEGFQLVDWCYQKIPDSIVWVARSDGALLSCTYIREQQVLAWARHDFTNGFVENVCTIPENGAYAVYLVINRTINGATVRYLERMSSRIWSDEINATYLDCFSSYIGTNAGSTMMTLLTPAAGFITDGTAYTQQITLQASSAFFTADMVGNQIVLSDGLFASGIGSQGPDGSLAFLGTDGNQIRCTIQAFISSTQVTVTPSGMVPATLQNTAVTTWSRAVQSVSGLGYLAGQQVSVWADRFVVGSPLNSTIATKYTVPANGILTLDKPYSVIYIGLPMKQDLEPLDLETYFGETMLSKRKRVGRVSVYAYKTRTFFCGSENPDINNQNTNSDPLFDMFEEKRGTNQVQYDDPPELWTDQDYVITQARWSRTGRFFIRNVDPTPLTLLAISAAEEDPAQGPYKRT